MKPHHDDAVLLEAVANRRQEQPHLTDCIHQLVLESQLPHKIVNLLFQFTQLKQQVDDYVGELTF